MSRHYYDEELLYLQEAGKLFAETYPKIADKLNPENVKKWDPYIERLLEGFAFLSGRIHERLDDNLTNYTESLFHMVSPQFLKPLPSCTIMQFKPRRSRVPETQVLQAGILVHSDPVGEERTSCTFQTTADVRLQPIELQSVTPDWPKAAASEWPKKAKSKVVLRFRIDRGIDPTKLSLSPIRLYLDVEDQLQSTLYTMYEFFVSHVCAVWVSSNVSPEPYIKRNGQKFVQPAGFAPNERLTPENTRSFSGFHLLQEFLCFPNKFWFIDLLLGPTDTGKKASFELKKGTEWFDVHVFFDEVYPNVEHKQIKEDYLRLHCTPAVNLFERTAEPIDVEGLSSEYRILPHLKHRKSMEAYDVQSVSGKEKETGIIHKYYNYYTYRNKVDADKKRFYATRRFKEGILGRPDIAISLSDADFAQLKDLPLETITVSLLCTNGATPHAHLNIKIDKLGSGIPRTVEPSNLTVPSLILYPPHNDRKMFYWSLISHWSLNFRTIADRDALVGLLELYDWSKEAQHRANRILFEAIDEVSWEPGTRIKERGVVRGAHVFVKIKEEKLGIKEEKLGDNGEMLLFGRVLSEFFASYASINSFIELTLERTPSGKKFSFKPERKQDEQRAVI